MTDQEINIAIAGACGWMRGDHLENSFADPSNQIKSQRWFAPGSDYPHRQVPDYCNDLNAMHDAENHLNAAQQLKYGESVAHLSRSSRHWAHNTFDALHATARQRAEAFLRTIGKWKETP